MDLTDGFALVIIGKGRGLYKKWFWRPISVSCQGRNPLHGTPCRANLMSFGRTPLLECSFLNVIMTLIDLRSSFSKGHQIKLLEALNKTVDLEATDSRDK